MIVITALAALGLPGQALADPAPVAKPGVPEAGRPLPRWRQPADPEPLLTAEYLELTVAREKGAMRVLSIERRAFARPKVLLPRFRGRFELRLLSGGGQLRDVVRFDLPLTGGAVPAPGSDEDDVLSRKLSLGVSGRTRVAVPFDPSIASAVLYDSLTKAAVRVDLSRFHSRAAPRLPAPAFKKTVPAKK